MSSKIEELIEKLAKQYPNSEHEMTVESFAYWLQKNAAPVVERCTSCDDTGDLIDLTGEWRGYCVCPVGEALKNKPVAPPELAELQAENSNLRLQCGGMETEIAELRAELERLKGGQGEPVAYAYKVYVHATGIGMVWRDKIEREAPDTEAVEVKDLLPLYASQPAPVSVVLPERATDSNCSEIMKSAGMYGKVNVWHGAEIWNACLDKVKELNQ